jgi:hypothetical protein
MTSPVMLQYGLSVQSIYGKEHTTEVSCEVCGVDFSLEIVHNLNGRCYSRCLRVDLRDRIRIRERRGRHGTCR